MASFVLPVLAVVSYDVTVAFIDFLVLAIPGSFLALVELTKSTGVPFVMLTGGPHLMMFGVFGLAGVVFLIAAGVYVVATILSVLSIVFGIVALVRRRPRVLPVTGIVMSALILSANLAIFLLFSTPWSVSEG